MTSISKRNKVFNKTNGKCIYCGCDLELNNFNMEHPISKQIKSSNSIYNLYPSCIQCNQYKHNLTIEEFRNKLENKLFDDFHVKMLIKYNIVETKKVIFYYEKIGLNIFNGDNVNGRS